MVHFFNFLRNLVFAFLLLFLFFLGLGLFGLDELLESIGGLSKTF